MGAVILFFLAPLLLYSASAAPANYPHIPGQSLSYDTPDMDFNRNLLGVHDLPPAARAKGELRGMLFGGSWVAGHGVPVESTMAKRLSYYLSHLTRKKVEIINAAFTEDTPLESLSKLQELLTAYKPDYVYLYFYAGPQLVNLGALDSLIDRDAAGEVQATHFVTEDSMVYRALGTLSGMSEEQKQVWLRLLNLQLGRIKFGRRVSGTANQAEEMLKPLLRTLNEIKIICARNGAKFVLLWPALALRPADWSGSAPAGIPFRALALLDPLKYPITVQRENFLEVLRTQDIPVVVNFEVSSYLYSVFTDPSTKNKPRLEVYKKTMDHMANLLATSILAQEL